MRKSTFLVAAGVAAVLMTASIAVAATRSTHAATARLAASVTITTRSVSPYGKILVTSNGRTIYMFVPDKQTKVSCNKTCQAVWPPVKASKGEKLVGKGGVKQSLLKLDKNPLGGYVVTYNRWPLYTYVADTAPGQAKGQGLNSTGGLWYVLSPSGAVIKKK
jgi:predicted lipoprotein with Yx(FWY)xxD motif